MTDATPAARIRPIDTLAGFLSAAAIAVALVGIPYRPFRLALPALLIALACVIDGGKFQRLATAAVIIAGTSWFAGMVIAVVLKHKLW